MPKVSVIIPNYNHEKYLLQRIESVLNQTFRDFEIIILDDFSTDGSRVVIEGFRSNTKVTHIVYNDKNSGSPFKQWEKGFLLAKGDWIWVAESDDYCESTFLQTLIEIACGNKHIGIAFCNSYWVNEQGHLGVLALAVADTYT